MIVTDRFVFLHLHKSGGTFVNECLLRFVPGARQLGYHLPRSMLPAHYARLPVLGMVRNPWSYYVSWYAFQSQQPKGNVLFQVASDNAALDFGATVRNLLELGSAGSSGHRKLDALVRALPAGYGGGGFNVPGPVIEGLRDSKLGLYSFLYRHILGEQGDAQVGRLERLSADLLQMLSAVDQPVSEDMRAFIEQQAPRNRSAHEDYTAYYDEELRALVAERDAAIIARHGYRFGN